MGDNIIMQLDAAAKIFLSPPTSVSAEERHQAELFFLEFRKTASPFALCREILETCQNSYVQFEAANLLRDGLLREWKQLPPEATTELKNYLLNYLVAHTSAPGFLRERLVQTVAILVKRRSVDDEGAQRSELLSNLQQLIRSPDINMQLLGCSLIAALLQEHANTLKSADVLLTWEQHFMAKKQFEVSDLRRIFEFCLSTLAEAEKLPALNTPQQMTLVDRLLRITESILSWSFTNFNIKSQRLIAVFESEQNPSLRPGVQWRQLMLNPDVVSLFFKMYWKVHQEDQLAHTCLNCLNQLASLNGTVIGSREPRVTYASHFAQNLLNILGFEQLPDSQCLGVAGIVLRFVLFFPTPILIHLPEELVGSLLQELTRVTCRFARAAARQEELHVDDQMYREAFGKLLEAWMMLLQEGDSFPSDLYHMSATQIFETYLQVHLAAPDGARGQVSDSCDDIDETEESDRVAYRDQLAAIGAFGRKIPERSVPLVTGLLEAQTERLQHHLQRVYQQASPLADRHQLIALHEDLHWTLMIAGHVLALDLRSETSLISPRLNQYSAAAGGSDPARRAAVVAASGAALRAAGTDAPPPSAEQADSVDPIVRLVCCGVRILRMLETAAQSRLSDAISPEVTCTTLWFMQRVTLTYLMPNENYYTVLSDSLLSAFGIDTDSSRWLVGFILSAVRQMLTTMAAEPDVVSETVQLLDTLCESKERGRVVIRCEQLGALVSLVSGDLQLPSAARRGLLKALVSVASTAPEPALTADYLTRLLAPLRASFVSVLSAPDFRQLYQEDGVRLKVLGLIEAFIGVSQGAQVQNSQHVFPVLSETLSDTLQLMDIYKNYRQIFELIMQLYAETAKRMLCFLKTTESRAFYDCCLKMIATYARHQSSLRAATSDSSAEEDSYSDLLLLMELLTNMLTKDIIDLGGHDGGSDGEDVAAADVCLYGLNTIMPLMSAELLRFPALCSRYFKLITFLCEITPTRILELPESLLDNLLSSVRLGLTEYGPEASALALDFLHQLTSHVVLHQLPPDHRVPQALRPFVKHLLDLILSNGVNSEVLQGSSGALFALICCFQDEYSQLAMALINSQGEGERSQRLAKAFTGLTQSVDRSLDRANRLKFRDAFKEFLVEIRGFMMVK
ncbi:exportin-4-like [Amphibalanus amphitrite]|uniref:exportin-4-like n=1 Tax=Amphibalanus amphitrite TaxID=1232801 RepID=UPI001C900271|nr:exportin-4-like [Amphibalanus amphitrite]XP_043189718.1 exportin-4-like [Amphibalanus amphitrite]XP_043189719.1 exportin-4-like [Amphibalanus amphitrite]